jgi:hypothetical protein
VTFMSDLFDLENLANRLRTFVARHDRFKPEAAALLEQTLVRARSNAVKHRGSRVFLFGPRSVC